MTLQHVAEPGADTDTLPEAWMRGLFGATGAATETLQQRAETAPRVIAFELP